MTANDDGQNPTSTFKINSTGGSTRRLLEPNPEEPNLVELNPVESSRAKSSIFGAHLYIDCFAGIWLDTWGNGK